MKAHKRNWMVTVGHAQAAWKFQARTPGAAARKAFRVLIDIGSMNRQPQTDHETGGWKGVSVVPVA